MHRGTLSHLALISVAVLLAGACSSKSTILPLGPGAHDAGTSGTADAGSTGAAPDAASTEITCTPCIMDQECTGGETCVQFAGDSYCASLCAGGQCAPGLTCMALRTTAGQAVSACVPSTCSAPPPPDAGEPSSGDGGTTHDGGRNNGGDGGPAAHPDANPIHATATDLRFAIVGDTRPALPDDTGGYPKTIINKIWQDVEAETPKPAFAVTTGDYMFAFNIFGDQANPQMDLYLMARAAFTNPVYYALGNHECNTTTGSNCGPGSSNGMTANYKVFLQKMMVPLGQSESYYSVRYDATDGSWSAKFVIIAGNAWNMDQQLWLDSALAEPTTYTFVVRHEPPSTTGAPGVPASEMVIAQHPLTLGIFGHTHTYRHDATTKSVIVGIGGAPLTGSMNYGYVIASRRASDGAIELDAKDYMSGMVFDHFAVKADGSPAP